ncbi:MAG: peptidoglycan DD-metalloendopeptidase family protein [Ardenticatenaceae bacterium]|nr:peptidoglycan DD-metalloendopeptidase family protein [Ardenticatenaceae bacterium]
MKNWLLCWDGNKAVAFLGLSLLFLLAGCADNLVTPTLVAPLNLPPAQQTEIAVTAESGSSRIEPGGRTTNAGLAQKAPTPAGVGIRPSQAEQLWVPDAGPEPPEGWRPPPYQVPLSLHYDDHYWLARPLPSGSRNYDLEWYPFGNDVQLPQLPSYRVHHGLDFPNETGTPVLAAGSGTVVHAGLLPSPRNGVNYYGNTVVILHDWQWQGKDVYTLYAHTLELFVQEGDSVQQGQLIAGVGSSGEVSGPHLHFEVRVGSNVYSNARNPALWLAPFEGWGTLAGRFVDKNNEMISGASLTLLPLNVDTAVRKQSTYSPVVRSDEVWQENFVIGDLPAGQYRLSIDANDGVHIYEREIEIFPGQTSFVIVSANFEFVPPPTPVPPEASADGDAADPETQP